MAIFGPVSVEIEEDIAWVTIGYPPVNAASVAVRKGLDQALDKLGNSKGQQSPLHNLDALEWANRKRQRQTRDTNERYTDIADQLCELGRLLAVLAKEGARIVDEGIAERASDVDMVQINGYGFPMARRPDALCTIKRVT